MENTSGEMGIGGIIIMAVYLLILIVNIVAAWKIFVKAGEPGWAILVPFYNLVIYLKIAGKPWWWLLLFFIPIANFIVAILWVFGLAKAFGKGTGFAVGLLFLGFIFYPVLAFSDAEYVGVNEG